MKILLTGANGYIGMRILPVLLEAHHTVTCVVRNAKRFPVTQTHHSNLHIVEADFLESSSLNKLPKDVDVAFYLLHSMVGTTGNFLEREKTMAQNFTSYLNQTSSQQIIYLTGIHSEAATSEHFKARHVTESILKEAKAAHTVLRAGIIVGSGSASFEIMRDLVEKLPLMVAPRWLKSRCQPIGIRDVLAYLTGAIGHKRMYNAVFDIGGPDQLSYKEMLLQFSEVRGLKRRIITLPLLSPRISSLWLYFVTSTSFSLARNLVDSMKFDVLMHDRRIDEVLPHTCMSYKKAVGLAFEKISQNAVVSSWKDSAISSGSLFTDPDEYSEVPRFGCFRDKQLVPLKIPINDVIENIWRIGGNTGYYYANALWKLRGYLDKVVGGIGLRRGRRSTSELNAGDALDFWRVLIADRKAGRLLLYAEMKLPGEAWLEFKIAYRSGAPVLVQTATFRPVGLLGRLYWLGVLPFHFLIFKGMAHQIASNSQRSTT